MKTKVKNKRIKDEIAGTLFTILPVLGIVVFTFIPLVMAFFMSFMDMTLTIFGQKPTWSSKK